MAVKRLVVQQSLAGPPGDSSLRQALHEADVNASLSHDNVVATYACSIRPLVLSPKSSWEVVDQHVPFAGSYGGSRHGGAGGGAQPYASGQQLPGTSGESGLAAGNTDTQDIVDESNKLTRTVRGLGSAMAAAALAGAFEDVDVTSSIAGRSSGGGDSTSRAAVVVEDVHGDVSGWQLSMVQEYCEDGTLTDAIKGQR